MSDEDWSRSGWRVHLPAVGDPGALVQRFGAQTIPALAAQSARRFGGKLAVTINGEGLTHAQLDSDASRLAGWLTGRCRPGDRVLLAAGASPGFLCCYLGALRAGAVVVLANPASTAAELGQLTAVSGAAIAIADRGPAQHLRRLGGPPVVGIRDLRTVLAGSPEMTDIRARPEDTALLAYTSGTTGRPKGVPLTHRELATSIRSAIAAWRWTGDDVLVHALPLHHQHGLGGVHATLIAGSTAHLLAKFSSDAMIRVMAETRATVIFGVPTIYQALADALSPPTGTAEGARTAEEEDAHAGSAGPAGPRTAVAAGALSGLRLAVCGSAPLRPDLADRLSSVLGVPLLVRYGTTETGLDVSNPIGNPRGDTVGLPLPGVLARIWSGGAEGPAGAEGEIQLRGPQVFAGYWQDPEATGVAFTPDGWFRTGDIGCIDPASGHLVIRGRIKELIITGGMNVHPREVELALESHPSVGEAVVAGVSHQRWGEQVTAWVVLRSGHRLDEEQLLAYARTLLSPYKCPKRVFEIESVPRSDLGKVLRAALVSSHELEGP